jgi:hypothetical protein
MAKGFNKSGLDILVWEVFRGSGRQLGRDLTKGISREVKKKTLDTTSKFRKYIDRFTLPGTAKGSISKMYTLIDQFYEEYKNTKTLFNTAMYMADDVTFINQKMKMTERMCFSDTEFRAYDNLTDTWKEILTSLQR